MRGHGAHEGSVVHVGRRVEIQVYATARSRRGGAGQNTSPNVVLLLPSRRIFLV